MRNLAALLSGLLSVCAALVAQTRYPDVVARVEDLSPGVSLLRADRPEKLQLLGDLLEGDVLVLEAREARVVIKLGNDMVAICHLDHRDPACGVRAIRYIVKGRAQPSLAAGIRRWLGGYLDSGLRVEDASVRGPVEDLALQIPLLKLPNGRVAATHQQLHFAWLGGHPPYALHLQNPRDESVNFGWTAVKARFTAPVALPVGNYEIRITDETGQSAQGRFRITGEPLPRDPEEPAGMDRELQDIYEAAWLASRGDGEWLFEAYQEACEHSSAYPPGRLLLQMLEAGQRPAPPDPGTSSKH
jgi:hypothetical protein